MKTLSSNSIKNEVVGANPPSATSKYENKENEFSQVNNNLKLNRTSSGRETQKNIKSMSGIKKLYTLKATNSSRRIESQNGRDFNDKYNESIKNWKASQNSVNYNSSLNGKRHVK